MPFLNSFFCCRLFVGSVLSGVYSMPSPGVQCKKETAYNFYPIQAFLISTRYVQVVYAVAFVIELWWIIEAEVKLPVPSYILAAGYFFTLVMSFALLAGLGLKRSKYLLGWLFVVILFYFPECGLVLFMSLYYWGLDTYYGLTEFAFYICRAIINVLCIVCVQSQYSSWQEEKDVMRRLENLNVVPKSSYNSVSSLSDQGSGIIKQDGLSNNSHASGTMERFRSGQAHDSELHLSTIPNGGVMNLSRNPSNSSNLYTKRQNGFTAFGIPANGASNTDKSVFLGRSIPPPSLPGSAAFFRSEFDAASFSDFMTSRPRAHVRSLSDFGYALQRQVMTDSASDIPNYHSYVNGGFFANDQDSIRDYRNGFSSANSSVGYSTQSLERSKYRRTPSQRRSRSLEDITLQVTDDVTLKKLPEDPFQYLGRPGSRMPDDIQSSSTDSIRDIAL
ncbi:reduction in Cnn dots 6 isoform X1 [Tachypleus tridentatus]|uniref:reduction in Cnn dots 6 isoform X1 n=1 Tax=Tachypleus tridentatus TaxID=6853 RepID=UPI003FD187FB